MLLVLLQNAWAHDARGAAAMQEKRRLWIWALAQSRSGQRLQVMLGADCFDDPQIRFENCTREIAIGAAHILMPPQPDFVREVLAEHAPQLVVACGRVAQAVLENLWQGPVLCLPHPAHRDLGDEVYLEAGKLIRGKFTGRIELAARTIGGVRHSQLADLLFAK